MLRELSNWWRRVLQRGGPPNAAPILRASIAWCGEALDQTARHMVDISQEFRHLWEAWHARPAPADLPIQSLYYQTRIALVMLLSGWFLVGLEGVFSGILSLLFLNTHPGVALVTGAVVAFLLAIALKGLVIPLFVARWEDMPKAARDRLVVWLLILVPAWLGLLTLGFVARGLTGPLAASLAPFFGPLMGLLATVTPLLAALVLAGGELYRWSGRLSAQHRDEETLAREIRALEQFCREALEQLAGPEEEPPPGPVPVTPPWPDQPDADTAAAA